MQLIILFDNCGTLYPFQLPILCRYDILVNITHDKQLCIPIHRFHLLTLILIVALKYIPYGILHIAGEKNITQTFADSA